jgi:hypothetical protein
VITLRQIAHARTGDKGNTCNISLIAFDARDYPRLLEHATPAVNLVMTHALGGGVTRSLALDAHGKSLSSRLLDLEI